jgi:hypothetical protein
MDIHLPHSSFLGLINRLDSWHQSVPDYFRVTPANSYFQTENRILGSVFFLSFLFNATMFDLTRISLPGFNFPLAAAFRRAPLDFKEHCQARCRYHANQISELIRQGLVSGKDAFRDPFCTHAAFESLKILIVHSTTSMSQGHVERDQTVENIRTNLNFICSILQYEDAAMIYVRFCLWQVKFVSLTKTLEQGTASITYPLWLQ